MSLSVTAFLTLALSELRAVAAGDVAAADDLDLALLMLNEYLDLLNVTDRALFNVGFTTFTLTPSLQPHTIGLAANTPTFTVTTARPTAIRRANLVIPTNIRVPLDLLDDEAWADIAAGAAAGQTPTITSSIPTSLYYSPDWPTGSIYLWPVPTAAYGLELETKTLLAALTLTGTLNLPPGYQQALRLSVAERCAPHLGLSVSPQTAQLAREARAAVWGHNDVIPTLTTWDGGMPGNTAGGAYDYRTGRNSL